MHIILAGLVVVFLAAHAGLGWFLHHERPKLEILPPVPSRAAAQALSFGDSQFLYRVFALEIQNAGDTGGRFTPMNQYPMTDVIAWLEVLQRLDPRSNHYTALAVRYFSQKRVSDDLRLLVDFISRDVDLAPDRKWFWQTQAVVMARKHLKDNDYALKLAHKIASYGDVIPVGFFWARQMEPALLADLGRAIEARTVMDGVIATYGSRMNEAEKLWTKSFYEQVK